MRNKKYDIKILKEIIRRAQDDVQNMYTPLELCEKMTEKLPELNKEQKILIMFNIEFIYVIREKLGKENMGNVWFYTGSKIKKQAAITMGVNENHIVDYIYENKKIIIKTNEKYDIIIGHLPYKYSKINLVNIHLKMLNILPKLLNKNGIIISLNSAIWVINILAKDKKGSEFNKYKHLPFTNIELLLNKDIRNIYDLNLKSIDLMISRLQEGKTSILLDETTIFKLRRIPLSVQKIINKPVTKLKDVIEQNKRDGYRIRIRIFTRTHMGIIDNLNTINYMKKVDNIMYNGKINDIDWTLFFKKNKYSRKEGDTIPDSIKFNTITEAKNYIEFINTNIYKFLIYLYMTNLLYPIEYLPFMDDYTKKWGDKELQKFFEIDEKTMTYINETIASIE